MAEQPFRARDEAERIASRLAELLIPPVVLHEPVIDQPEMDSVAEALKSGWVSTAGPFVERFEEAIGRYTGAKYVVATSSGTAALHIALKLAGVEENDEVLVPALSFVATANAVAYCAAVPHFVDVNEASLGICPTKLAARLAEIAVLKDGVAWNVQSGRRIRALVPMHTFGHVAETSSLQALADRYGIALVEDAAESLGSWDNGSHTGTKSLLAALSFNGNKVVTTGGGGAILTSDARIAARARHLTTTARVTHPWRLEHDELGYNYRLPNLNAALGLAQLARLEWALERKRMLVEVYERALSSLGLGHIVHERAGTRSNYWLHCMLLNEGLLEETLTACHRQQIYARPAWTPLHQLPMYARSPRADLGTTESLCSRLLCLPSGPRVVAQLRGD